MNFFKKSYYFHWSYCLYIYCHLSFYNWVASSLRSSFYCTISFVIVSSHKVIKLLSIDHGVWLNHLWPLGLKFSPSSLITTTILFFKFIFFFFLILSNIYVDEIRMYMRQYYIGLTWLLPQVANGNLLTVGEHLTCDIIEKKKKCDFKLNRRKLIILDCIF